MALLYRFHTIEALNEFAKEFPSLRGKRPAFPKMTDHAAPVWRACDALYQLGKPVNVLSVRPLLVAEGYLVERGEYKGPNAHRNAYLDEQIEAAVTDWLTFHMNMREAMRAALYKDA